MALGYSLRAFFGLYLLQSVLAAEHWGYPDPETTDVFPKWGGICDNGRLQSPIDLTIAGSLKGSFPDLDFHNYDKTLTSPLLLNNGHTVKLSKFSVAMTLSGGPLSHKYNVEEVHLHWWSEHTIDKIRYPLEAHIVHRNKKYPNITEAANHKDGIAVVGVLFHVSNKANTGIGKIAENIEFINGADEINKPVILEQKLNLRELFPTISSGYLTYEGSLTTPSCAESVTWIVLLDTFPVTLEQVNQFKAIETTDGKKLSNNYREVQKKNNRAVVVIQETRSVAAPSTTVSTLVLSGSLLFMFLRSTIQQ